MCRSVCVYIYGWNDVFIMGVGLDVCIALYMLLISQTLRLQNPTLFASACRSCVWGRGWFFFFFGRKTSQALIRFGPMAVNPFRFWLYLGKHQWPLIHFTTNSTPEQSRKQKAWRNSENSQPSSHSVQLRFLLTTSSSPWRALESWRHSHARVALSGCVAA